MASGGIEQDEVPIGELVGRLIDDGKGFAHAEFGLAKAKAEAKTETLKLPALLLGGAFLFLQAGVVGVCAVRPRGRRTISAGSRRSTERG